MARFIIVTLLIVSTADLVLPFSQASSGLVVAVSQNAARSSSSSLVARIPSLVERIPNPRRGSKPALGNLLGLCKASQGRESSQQDARLRKAGLRKRHVELLDGSKLFVVEAAKTSDMVEQWIENQMATVGAQNQTPVVPLSVEMLARFPFEVSLFISSSCLSLSLSLSLLSSPRSILALPLPLSLHLFFPSSLALSLLPLFFPFTASLPTFRACPHVQKSPAPIIHFVRD